jgi:two-component system, OmpR family, KDP operon response regulator KdpE
MRRVLHSSLNAIGYRIQEASSGEAALESLDQKPDLVLLDLNMPGMGGLEACRRIREVSPSIGIMIVSVREALDDKVRAFEAGADDYITKPFRFRELAARLSAVRRRIGSCEKSRPMLRVANLELDPENRTFRKSGQEIHLSQKEFDILAYLMSRPNTTVPHARLLQAVWGPEYGGEMEYLRTYIKHLRRKIERDAAQPEFILTEPWIGYRFRDASELSLKELSLKELTLKTAS